MAWGMQWMVAQQVFLHTAVGMKMCGPGLELLLAQKSSPDRYTARIKWLCCMTALVHSHQEAQGCFRMGLWGQSGYNSCPASSLW